MNKIHRLLREIEDARMELEELCECGDLEEQLEAAFVVEYLERKLVQARAHQAAR